MKTLKLKNYFFVSAQDTPSIQVWLERQALHGAASRSRTRFVKLLADRLKEIDTVRKEMLEKHAEKDKDGKTIYVVLEEVKKGDVTEIKEKDTTDDSPQDNKRYKIKDDKAFNKEWAEYINEEFVLDVTPSTSEIIYGTRDLILNTTAEFSGRGAALYDEWCQAFEAIKTSDTEAEAEKK